MKSFTQSQLQQMQSTLKESRTFTVEKYKKYTQSLACLVMFLIGAPLGAIIKKGGLGVPVLVSITFFIIFYVLSLLGEKWAKEGLVEIAPGVWTANFILFLCGLFFLRQARNDSRIFESDMYKVAISRLVDKMQKRFSSGKQQAAKIPG
jgi:lipopolysaccharide export system permease protein